MLDRCADHRLRVGGGVRRWLRGVSPLRGASSTAAHVRLLADRRQQHGRHGNTVVMDGESVGDYWSIDMVRPISCGFQFRLQCSEPSLPFCFRAQLLNRLIKLTKFSDSIAEGTHLTSLKQVRRRRYEKSALFEPQTSLEKNRRQTNRQTDKQTDEQKDSTVALCPRFCEQEHNNLSIGYILFANSNVEWSSVTVLLEQWYLTF